MKTALRPFEEHVKKLEQEMQWLREDQEKLLTVFEGKCPVRMLRNKSVIAHMEDVNGQLEEIKKTLDDFKIEGVP